MKFIHISDVNLGIPVDILYPWSRVTIDELFSSLEDIIRICNEENIDLLLISGDLFNRQPLLRELYEVNDIFLKLKRTIVVLIAGDNDYIKEDSYYLDFDWCENVYMFKSDRMESVYFESINTQIFAFSYHSKTIEQAIYDNVKPYNTGRINILLAHGGDDKHIPINFDILSKIPFDYVALGHSYKPYIINNRIAYSGSLEPLNIDETGERGYILGDIIKDLSLLQAPFSKCEIRFISHELRQYVNLEVKCTHKTTFQQLKDYISYKISEIGINNIYKVVMTGIRGNNIEFRKDELYECGHIASIIDDTVIDYDFEGLYEKNKDNIIGMYIEDVCRQSGEDEVLTKALYYGMEALLSARNSISRELV